MGSGGRWIVPLLAGVARERFPHIALHIIEGSNSTLEPRLIAGALDLAVLAGPVDAPELTSTVLFEEDLVLIVPREHPLAQLHSPVALAALADFELLLPLAGTPMRREIDDACKEQGVELRPLLEMDGMRTIASLTFDGMGISILPATMLSQHLRDKFVAVPLRGVARRQVVLVGRRFGFPAAPVRAIQSLLGEAVRTSEDVPAGVYVASPSSAIISR
jgi:DNA-binding transcriptional LysR family regulator